MSQINEYYHKKKNGKHWSIETQKNILVYKVIKHEFQGEYHGTCYYTPVVRVQVEFNMPMLTTSFEQFTHSDNSIYGFHSFASLQAAKRYIKNMGFDPEKYKIHDAIVPRLAKYYVCENEEILSNKIIILNTTKT